MTAEPLPPQLHAASLHDLVDAYVQLSLERGDLGALGPLGLLRDRVEALLAEHARGRARGRRAAVAGGRGGAGRDAVGGHGLGAE